MNLANPLFWLSAAALCLSLTLSLWAWACERHRHSQVDYLLTQNLVSISQGDALRSRFQRPQDQDALPHSWLIQFNSRAGLNLTTRHLVPLGLACLASLWLIGAWLSWYMTPITLGAILLVFGIVMRLRMQAVQHQRTRALPVFLDALIRSLSLGNSMPAAFVGTASSAPTILRACLHHTSTLMQAGLSLDLALRQTARLYQFPPLALLASVTQLSIQYGGAADQVLERIANFLRDRQEAQQELMALSSETRLSALVIGLLPLAVALLLSFISPTYMSILWNQATGRILLWIALGLQALGIFLLIRMTRLKE